MQSKIPTYIMMVGLPGSGKSTIATQRYPFFEICSTDNIIECMAEEIGLTYNEMFKKVDFKRDVQPLFDDKLQFAFGNNQNVLVDQTNMSLSSRMKKLSRVPKHYKKICVYVNCTEDVRLYRCFKREAFGKSIPTSVILNMKSTFSYPIIEEGFDEVVEIQND